MAQVPIDICFCLDATMSTNPVINALKDRISDITADINFSRRPGVTLSKKFAIVAYRDPIDRPRDHPAPERLKLKHRWDEHEYQDFGGVEALEEFLSHVESYGGGDEPEDWAGALDIALHRLSWRAGKKCIIWIGDANAHGARFALPEERDHHPEEEARLVALIDEVARNGIYFVGINVRKGTDPGCAKTFTEIRNLCEGAGGKPVRTDDFVIEFNEDGEFVDPNQDFSPDLLSRFQETVVSQINTFVGDMTDDLI